MTNKITCPKCNGKGYLTVCPICGNRGCIQVIVYDEDGKVIGFKSKDCPNKCQRPVVKYDV